MMLLVVPPHESVLLLGRDIHHRIARAEWTGHLLSKVRNK
jgi:hypothetical protein